MPMYYFLDCLKQIVLHYLPIHDLNYFAKTLSPKNLYCMTLNTEIVNNFYQKTTIVPLISLLLGWPNLVMMMFHFNTDVDINEIQCIHSFSSAKKRLVI